MKKIKKMTNIFEATTSSLLLLRLFNILLIAGASTMWIIYGIRYKCLAIIAPLSWLFHVLIYGVYRFVTPETIENQLFMQNWTAVVMSHAIILLLLLGILANPPLSYIPPDEKEDTK